MQLQNYIIIFFLFLLYFFFLKRYPVLSDNQADSEHKKFVIGYSSPILLGGVFIYSIVLIFLDNDLLFLKIILGLIFVIGILSDKNILPNPKLRLLLQIIILFVLVHFENLEINNLSSNFLNNLLTNNFFNICFTVFCLAVLINGSNFIDGLNGLLAGYCIMVILSIMFVIYNFDLITLQEHEIFNSILISLFLFFIFNFIGLVFLGDSGSYLISAFVGVYLIKLILINTSLSPYYIALILWYPAFENLFSLLRRTLKNKNASLADNLHFHQLLYLYVKSLKLINEKIVNSFTGVIIILLNIPSFIVASVAPFYSNKLIIMILINIVSYLIIYKFLFSRFVNKK
tara:strand:- start:2527 stop:3558 length:1032 start_codon:yes stop_codon:yes gene_type:complete